MFRAKNVIIDSDPGIDDAVALACAFSQKKYNISLICASCGNLNTTITSKNCLNLCHYYGRHFPVAKGAKLPINGILNTTASNVHGANGLGGVVLPDSPYDALKEPAYEAMYKTLVKNGKQNTEIWLLAPATNVVLMLQKYPDASEYIKRIVVMGGSIEGVSNSLEIYDEFNILFDPAAMSVLIDSRIPIIFVPMEIGHNCFLSPEEIVEFSKINKTCAMYAEMFKHYHDGHVINGAAMHDATVIYYALYPNRFDKRYVFSHINLKGKNVGQVEFSISPNKTKNVLCFNTDTNKFKKWLFKVFKRFR